jgi:large subunit ribosomal protein L4
LPEIGTKYVVQALDRLKLGRNVMLVSRQPLERLKLSARNIKQVKATTVQSLNAYQLLQHHRVVLEKAAVEAVEEVFAR